MFDLCLINPPTKANIGFPNVALGYVSACLKEINVLHRIIDHTITPYPLQRYLKYGAERYGIFVKDYSYREAQKIISELTEEGVKDIFLFGPYVDCARERCEKENPNVGLLEEYWDYLDYKKVGSLDDLPFPNYDKFDNKFYLEECFQTGKFLYPLITSRGCPFRCIFCVAPCVFYTHKHLKLRSPESCYEELKYAIEKYHIKGFHIMDDDFTLKEDRAIRFCELVRPLGLPWACFNGVRADQFTWDVAQAMKDAGCYFISFGVESTDPEVLKLIKKGETFEQIERAVTIAKTLEMEVNGYFIIGLPGSSYEKDIKSWEWAQNMGIHSHFSVLVPMEGSELYREYNQNIINDPIDGLFYNDRGEMNCVYETPDYPCKKRIELYNKVMGRRRI